MHKERHKSIRCNRHSNRRLQRTPPFPYLTLATTPITATVVEELHRVPLKGFRVYPKVWRFAVREDVRPLPLGSHGDVIRGARQHPAFAWALQLGAFLTRGDITTRDPAAPAATCDKDVATAHGDVGPRIGDF